MTSKYINLSDNQFIEQHNIQVLIAAIQANKILKSMAIKFGAINQRDTKLLAAAIAGDGQLKNVQISFTSDRNITEYVDVLSRAVLANPNIQSLVLSIPEEMTGSGFELYPLCSHLSGNTTLQSLTLKNNRITVPDAQALADVFAVNHTLQTLVLNNNDIDEDCMGTLCSTLVTNTGLDVLDLSQNNLKGGSIRFLCNGLEGNQTLTTLVLRASSISVDGFLALGGLLATNTTGLRKLDLSTNSINKTGGNALGDGLRWNTTLTNLNLNQCFTGESLVGARILTPLFRALAVNNTLEILDINSNSIEVVSEIANMLQFNKSIRVLLMGRNNYSNISSLADALMINKTLETLEMNYTGMTQSDLQLLAMSLEHNKGLKNLSIKSSDSSTKANYNAMERLCNALRRNKTLESLAISYKKPDDRCTQLLADVLSINIPLRHLDISGNNVGDNGAIAIAIALQTNRSLQRLEMDDCDIRTVGMRAITGMLLVNKYLTSLSIKHNSIGDAIPNLARVLLGNKPLENIDLWRCGVGDDGAVTLAEALQTNTRLKVLELGSNRITHIGARALAKTLETNQHLCVLGLGHNDIDSDIQQVIDGYLTRNNNRDRGVASFS